jgi:glycine C-acetyltransferase
MSLQKIESQISAKLAELQAQGILKSREQIITGIIPAANGNGPRYLLDGCGQKAFLSMNSNSYLGLSNHAQVITAEAAAAEQFGAGPGAVRFIRGTFKPHIDLEKKLAAFHNRAAAMLISSAYATVVGVLPQFITAQTLVVSDALNHNCIINAIRLSRPAAKAVYPHLDLAKLEQILVAHKGRVNRVCVVTDGIFSMRGDHAPLAAINTICQRHEDAFAEGIINIVDDSHGVGAFGRTGRGTEEFTQSPADILIATLGKAFGVNGGYVTANAQVIQYLRETTPLYIYSNPITPAEAAAAHQALTITDSAEGMQLLKNMRSLAAKLRSGLQQLGFETLAGEHPIVPVLLRDSRQTSALVQHLFANNILATGLNYPVVPKGEEEIRLQVSAVHTEPDIESLLNTLQEFQQT